MGVVTSRIRRGRELAGLTMGQAARLLGLTVAQVSDFEIGRTEPTPDQLAALAELYGVGAAWLEGAEPVIPDLLQRVLRKAYGDGDLRHSDRETLLEVAGAVYTTEHPTQAGVAAANHIHGWQDFLATVEVGGPIPITFSVIQDALGVWSLHSTMLVPSRDSDDRCACGRRANDTPVTIVNALPGPEVDKAIAIRQRVLGHYQHEALEHIHIGGVRTFDPHEARWFSNLVADWRFNR